MKKKSSIYQVESNIGEALTAKSLMGKELWEILLKEHPADIAELIERLSPEDQIKTIKKLPIALAGEVFEDLPETIQGNLLVNVGPDKASHILQKTPVDKLTDLFEYLSDEHVKKYLKLLQKKQRKQVISLLHFDPKSAGGIMNSDVFSLHKDFTIKKSISLLQKIRPRKEHIEKLYVTDKQNILLGHIHLDDFVLNKPEVLLKDILHKNELAIRVHESQETVAKQMQHYSLLTAPVVDEHNHFLGIITADDVFEVIEEEASEDVYKISGISPIRQSYFQTPFWRLIWQRTPWLVGLLLLQSISGIIMYQYQSTLDGNLVLAFFLTMLIGTGGNAGNQTGALVVRGLAMGEIGRNNGLKMIFREFFISIIMAIILSIIAFARVFITHSDIIVAATISVSLFIITVVSMLMGVLLPLLLERLNFDPAHSAQPFLATLMDIIGILILFFVASKILVY